MLEQNLHNNISINNHDSVDDPTYQMAVEHLGWCMWSGMAPYQVMASVGVPAPIDVSWNQALGVIWSKSMQISNKETP